MSLKKKRIRSINWDEEEKHNNIISIFDHEPKKKRIRSINWDEEEKQLFRSVLKEFAALIENKSLDNNANKLKTKAWEEVQKKFNELNGRLRSLNELKIQWKTMKINARKEVSLFKRTSNKTGGGGRPQIPTNDSNNYVDTMINYTKSLKDQEHQKHLLRGVTFTPGINFD